MNKSCRYLYFGVACAALGCLLIQVYLAGAALFQDSAYWDMHKSFALFKYGYLIMVVAGLLGKLPRSLTWLALLLFAVANAQYYTAHGFMAALHVVVPFLLFWLTLVVIRGSFHALRSDTGTSAKAGE